MPLFFDQAFLNPFLFDVPRYGDHYDLVTAEAQQSIAQFRRMVGV
jgi:hypothetical protein